jgi:hypothetical protein
MNRADEARLLTRCTKTLTKIQTAYQNCPTAQGILIFGGKGGGWRELKV